MYLRIYSGNSSNIQLYPMCNRYGRRRPPPPQQQQQQQQQQRRQQQQEGFLIMVW